MVDGVVYRAASDGSIEAVADDETIPFAAVTVFGADETQSLEAAADIDDLRDLLDARLRRTSKELKKTDPD